MHNGAVTDLGAADVFNIHPYAVVDAEVPKLSGFGQSSHAANLQPYQLGDVLALALYQAFARNSAEIDTALAGLKTALGAGEVLAQDDKTAFAEAQKAEQALAQAILQGWYLGVVGKGKKSVCVAYVETLSNRAVADVLVPPSFSYGPCGSWSAKP